MSIRDFFQKHKRYKCFQTLHTQMFLVLSSFDTKKQTTTVLHNRAQVCHNVCVKSLVDHLKMIHSGWCVIKLTPSCTACCCYRRGAVNLGEGVKERELTKLQCTCAVYK